MKKMLAMICALALCCTAFAACSSNDDSSETKSAQETTTAATEATEAPAETDASEADIVTTADESTADDPTTTSDEVVKFEYDGELFSETYTKKLQEGYFSIQATMEGGYFGEGESAESLMESAGLDLHEKTTFDGVSNDMYLVDKILYVLDEENKTYTVMDYTDYIGDDPAANASMALGLTEELVLTNRTEADGLIVEEYTYDSPFVSAEDFADGQRPKYVYYFKDNGDLVKVEIIFNGAVQTYNIVSVDFDIKDITLPDLSDWTLSETDTGIGTEEEPENGETEESTAETTEEIVP